MWYKSRVSSTSPAAIGRTLSGLGRLARAARAELGAPADVPTSREAIHQFLAEAAEPLPIDQICASTGLHANTVRTHLDVLQAAGRVTRERGGQERRGRPPWLYRAVETEAQRNRRILAHALHDQLESAHSDGLAQDTAAKWAEHLAPEHVDAPADTPDAAVATAARSLTDLGFTVTVNPIGDRMDIGTCPYADLVADRPVICDIHAALLQQLFESSGQPVALDRLDVWSRQGLCTAHLIRRDQRPFRTIEMRSTE